MDSCWASLPLANGSNLNVGEHVLPLFKGAPVPAGEKRDTLKPIEGGTLHISVASGDNVDSEDAGAASTSAVPAGVWRNVPKVTPPSVVYGGAANGFDLYIDGARFLPYNCTISKAVGRVLTADMKAVGHDIATKVDLNSSSHMPMYGYRLEFRDVEMKADSMIVLKIYGIDLHSKELVIVGYAALNVFVMTNSFNGVPPFHTFGPTDPSEISLNEGGHQCRLFLSGPDMSGKNPLSMEQFDGKPFIPCASVLLRLLRPPMSGGKSLSTTNVPKSNHISSGLIVPAPKYADDAYYTGECTPTEEEIAIYHSIHRRKKVKVRDMIGIVNTDRKLKDDKSLLRYLQTRLTRVKGQETEVMDRSYVVTFDREIGVSIAVDAATHLPKAKLTFPVVSTVPPARLYHPASADPSGPVHQLAASKVEWSLENAMQKSPKYDSDWVTWNDHPFTPKDCVIVDLRVLEMKKKEWVLAETQGWALMPLMSDEKFVRHGTYQLPVFAGAPPVEVLDKIAEDGFDVIHRALAQKAIKHAEGCSVTVRVADPRRKVEVVRGDPKPNTADIPQDKHHRYGIGAPISKSKQIKTLVPKGVEEDGVKDLVLGAFKELKPPEAAAPEK